MKTLLFRQQRLAFQGKNSISNTIDKNGVTAQIVASSSIARDNKKEVSQILASSYQKNEEKYYPIGITNSKISRLNSGPTCISVAWSLSGSLTITNKILKYMGGIYSMKTIFLTPKYKI
ncbi:hypothetical protein TNIN_412671 [Trichonephila inaurata madagascariensis]|uniref:Uncharacterized protein n=1 Tax=Trichonephila inaurata madagascariensis TaxID=2747483 RepID=A0A8X7C3L8_9ARAC|nr:hypothetical protein TNIN_412671 [Trichonephila inaurata madagascariensis]